MTIQDTLLASANLTAGLDIRRLKSFHTYPSRDGGTLFSMTVPIDGPSLYMEADRCQVTAAAQELNMAAYMMAQRSGLRPDPAVAHNWVLEPDIDHTLCRYNPYTRMLNIAWCFNDRLPMPMAICLQAYLLLRDRCDAACGLFF
jgi:hypothetical protein